MIRCRLTEIILVFFFINRTTDITLLTFEMSKDFLMQDVVAVHGLH